MALEPQIVDESSSSRQPLGFLFLKLLSVEIYRFEQRQPGTTKALVRVGKFCQDVRLQNFLLLAAGILLQFNIDIAGSVVGGIILLVVLVAYIAQLMTTLPHLRKSHHEVLPMATGGDTELQGQSGQPGAVTPSTPSELEAGKKRHLGPSEKRYDNDYTGLAKLMIENPEKAIVRRFALLNMKNLLYMQAELAVLEDQLEQAIEHDKKFTDTQMYAQSWIWLDQGWEYLQKMKAQKKISVSANIATNTSTNDQKEGGANPEAASQGVAPTGGNKQQEGTQMKNEQHRPAIIAPAQTPISNTTKFEGPTTEEVIEPANPVMTGDDHKGNNDQQDQAPSENDQPLLQKDLVKKIRDRLERYNTALEQMAFSFGLSKPKRMDLKDLQKWLRREGAGEQFLLEVEAKVWQPVNEDDLIGLALPPGEDDAFSTAVSKRAIVIFSKVHDLLKFIFGSCFGRDDRKVVLIQWNDSWLLFIVSFVFTTLAACFPVLAILALYKAQENKWGKGLQIGMIGAFSGTCAGVLALAQARRTDVFLATSAFAAVMVVFIKS